MNREQLLGIHILAIAVIMTGYTIFNSISEPLAFGASSLLLFSFAYLEYKETQIANVIGMGAMGLGFVGVALIGMGIRPNIIEIGVYICLGSALLMGIYSMGVGVRGTLGHIISE